MNVNMRQSLVCQPATRFLGGAVNIEWKITTGTGEEFRKIYDSSDSNFSNANVSLTGNNNQRINI